MTFRRVITVVGVALVGLVFLGFAAHVVERVASGHGLDTYFTGRQVQFNYFGALVVLLVVLAAIGAAGVVAAFRYLQRSWRRPGDSSGTRTRR